MFKKLINKLIALITQKGTETTREDVDALDEARVGMSKENGSSNSNYELTSNEELILEEYFLPRIKTIKENSFFLHGGFEDLNYSPLKKQPIWLAYFTNETEIDGFSYGSNVCRRYVTKFRNESELKLLHFKEVNTAPIAERLKLCTSQRLDRALALYLKKKGVQGLIGPTNHVLLIEPINAIMPIEFDNIKSDFLLALISLFESGRIKCNKCRVKKGEVFKSDQVNYKALIDFDVLAFDQEEINQIEFKTLSLDGAIYHLARYIDSKPAVIGQCIIDAMWYEKNMFIEKTNDFK